VHTIRHHPDFLPELSFVATVDEEIVGYIMYTRSCVREPSGATRPTITFGPVCVHPANQAQGIGSTLIRHSLEMARRMGHQAVIILGDPHHYCKQGFRNSADFGISNADGKYPAGQLLLELEPGFFHGITGSFFYSDAFQLDPEKVAEFDRSFPIKEKKWQPSQEIYSILSRAYLEFENLKMA